MNRPFTLSDFDFALPPELIAQQPAPERTASRLLHVNGAQLNDLHFSDLPGLLRAGDLLVFNDTRVIKARLHGRKASGGKVEALIERVIGNDAAMAQVRASHPPAIGSLLEFGSPAFSAGAKVVDRDGRFFLLAFSANVWDVLEHLGEADAAAQLMRAIETVTSQPALHTRDLGGRATTREVTEAVLRALGEILGLDPLYVANEGRFAAILPERDAERALEVLSSIPVTAGAARIGRVRALSWSIILYAAGTAACALAPNLPVLVLGASGGSNPVSLGAGGSSLALTTDLVVMAQGSGGRIEVTDTAKRVGDLHVHVGKVVKGPIKVGDTAAAEIDASVALFSLSSLWLSTGAGE